MKLRRNLAAGLGSSIFTAVVGLAVVPLYLRYLGVEAYGLIGFFAATQALFQLLDMGLAQTLNREISRYSAESRMQQAGNLLHTLAVIYWSVAAVIAVVVFLFAPLIAGHWIKADKLSEETVRHAVQLIGVVIACRWPVGLYQGALNGLQLNTVTGGVAVAATTLGSGGAVLLLAFVSPSIETFFVWQACVGFAYALTLRGYAWRALGVDGRSQFDVGELRRIWTFAMSVAAITVSAIVFTQLDKVILSKILSLRDFACYMLATVVASGLYFLVTPLFNVVYPRFSYLVARGDDLQLGQLYRVGTRLFATALFPVAFVVAAFARDIVLVWTGDPALADSVAPVLGVLAIGTALHGIMHFPYALQLAFGMPRLALKINLMLMIVLVPVTIVLASRFGALGGAMAWLILHTSYVLLGTWMTHRNLLREIGAKWLVFDVARPLVVAALTVVAARHVVDWLRPGAVLALALAGAAALMAIAFGLASSPQACRLVLDSFRSRRVMA
jgi:O-antigen/teichoic acid export membrane protein